MARKEPLVYYQPDIETMSREDLEALQLERLQALVKRVYQKIPFYKESFDKAGTLKTSSHLPTSQNSRLR